MRPSVSVLLGAFVAVKALALGAGSAAGAQGLTPRSFIPGNTFDRFVQIFLENQDYAAAIANCKKRPSCRMTPTNFQN
jgi:hypothetical protein